MDFTPIDASGRGGGRKPLADIPADTAEAVEEAYMFCTAAPDKRLQTAPFANREEAEDWLRDARAYAYQRPAGRLVVAGNPARAAGEKADGKYVIRLTVTDFSTDEAASESE
jgi:hypothetical protein